MGTTPDLPGRFIDRSNIELLADSLRNIGRDLLNGLLNERILSMIMFDESQALLFFRPDMFFTPAAHDDLIYDYKAQLHALMYSAEPESIVEQGSVLTERLIRHFIYDPTDSALPNDFWTLITGLTWLQPEYQREIASTLENYFRSRTFFTRDGFSNSMVLSPNTYWLLVSMAGQRTIWQIESSGPRQRLNQQAVVRALTQLVGVATRLGLDMTYGPWATLWDQWVLRRAVEVGADHAPDEVITELKLLPLFHKTGAQQQASKLARSDWNTNAPAWFTMWEDDSLV